MKSATSLANTRGGFLIFGVSEKGVGRERIVGIPRSRENQKHFSDKVQRAEPPVEFTVLNPQVPVDDTRAVLVVEIHKARRGPHWYRSARGVGEFWKRSEGTVRVMTYSEIEEAFTNYSERVAMLHVIFVSLADNWLRLKEMSQHQGSDTAISPVVTDMSQIRQHLGVLNSLCPEATGSIFQILRICDSLTTSLQVMLPVVNIGLTGKAALTREHNRTMAYGAERAQPHFETVLTLLQDRFGFESVNAGDNRIPPVQ